MDALLVILAAVGSAIGGAGFWQWFGSRKREAASATKILAEADAIIRGGYEALIRQQQEDLSLARAEASAARLEAREANARAGEAEQSASRAVAAASKAELAIAEITRLVTDHVPDSEQLLREIQRIASSASLNGRVRT